MKERPILFSAPMVRAILDGRKTVTRRVIKHQPPVTTEGDGAWRDQRADLWRNARQYARDCSPYGVPGERLWVREVWADVNAGDDGPGIAYRAGGFHSCIDDAYPVEYERYPGCNFVMWYGDLLRGEPGHSWRSPIHMPRWACRLTLEVTEVRVERLQSITEGDAKAEGVTPGTCTHPDCSPGSCASSRHRPAFALLWDGLNARRGFGWDTNPWVWVVGFRGAA